MKDAIMARPEALVSYGTVQSVSVGAARMEKVEAGLLEVSSGAIGIGGICTGDWSADFDPQVPVANGLYEVALSQLWWQTEEFGEVRGVTAVTISAPNDLVEEWKPWVGPDGGHGGVFMEYGIGAAFDASKSDIADQLCSGVDNLIVEPLFEYTNDPWYMWHHGVVAFRGGSGDGVYDVWLGHNPAGHTTAIVIDLGLLG